MSDTATQVWLSFALCVAVIGVAGVKLTDYGDAIADKTGMGGTWIGLVLIATVTSLPELSSGISAVSVARLPDIAVGDALGSCVYNLFILALMDLFKRGPPVLADARREHVLSAAFGILLIGIASVGLAAAGAMGPIGPGILAIAPGIPVGWTAPLLVALYSVSMRTLYRYQKREVAEFTSEEADRYPGLGLRAIAIRYGIAALFVIAAGVWLPFVSEDISTVMGWQQSFTGTLFTALSTSVPELAVTLAAMRIGAVDLAVGNVLGSNLFNLLILAVDDLFYLPGPLLGSVSQAHLISATTALTMTGVLIVGIFYGSQRRILGLTGWASLLLFALFGLNSWLVFTVGRG